MKTRCLQNCLIGRSKRIDLKAEDFQAKLKDANSKAIAMEKAKKAKELELNALWTNN